MRIKQDLWKLIVRPVAAVKSSRMCLRWIVEDKSAQQRIRVSSAYWRIGHGRV
jgi:hypothetical protein